MTSTMTSTPKPRTILLLVTGLVVGLLAGIAATVGVGFAVLYAFNPVGDEYVCSEGEVPSGRAPVGPGEGNACYQDGELPRGYEADPLGNRPMSYNCDKSGHRLIEKTQGRGAGQVTECITDDTDIPSGWALSADDQ